MRKMRIYLMICISIIGFQQTYCKQIANNGLDSLLQIVDTYLKVDPSKAIYYASQAIGQAQHINDSIELAKPWTLLSEAYMYRGDFDLALEAIHKASLYCPNDVHPVRGCIYLNLSKIYNKICDVGKALQYMDKAMHLFETVDDSLGLARCYNMRGLILLQEEKMEEAEADFQQSLAIGRTLNHPIIIAAALNNLSLTTGKPKDQIKLLDEAIQINKQLGNVWSLSENYNNQGCQYNNIQAYGHALIALDSALFYAHLINAKELIADNYRYRTEVYAGMNDYRNAYEYITQLHTIERELLSDSRVREMEITMIRERLDEQERDMSAQSEFYKAKHFQLRFYMIAISTLLLVVVSISIFLLYRHKKKIQILEQLKQIENQEKELFTLKFQQAELEACSKQKELDLQADELTNFAFFVQSRNEMLSNIQAEIKKGYKLPAGALETHLRNINAYISQFSTSNTETELLIDKINRKFIASLSERHPDLSKNERRLAALLRIGMSSKEIASVIGSTQKTVNMARYRLRKKLELETDDSLTEYMRMI